MTRGMAWCCLHLTRNDEAPTNTATRAGSRRLFPGPGCCQEGGFLMQKRSWERRGALVSSVLLGAGLGCVLCLVPSPLRLLVLAGLTPLLFLGAWLGCGLGAGGLLLLTWIEHRATHQGPRLPLDLATDDSPPDGHQEVAPSRAPACIRRRHGLTFQRVCHAWRVVQPAPVDTPLEEETSGIPCHRCGVCAPRATLLRCEECCHLFHPACCRSLADGSEGRETLCHPCWNAQTASRQRRSPQAGCRPTLVRQTGADAQGSEEEGGTDHAGTQTGRW